MLTVDVPVAVTVVAALAVVVGLWVGCGCGCGHRLGSAAVAEDWWLWRRECISVYLSLDKCGYTCRYAQVCHAREQMCAH